MTKSLLFYDQIIFYLMCCILRLNQSLKTGIFPDAVKIAKVKPLYKKSDNSCLNNYRPISLFCQAQNRMTLIYAKYFHVHLFSHLHNDLYFVISIYIV